MPLPSGWFSQSVGAAVAGDSASYLNGAFTLQGSGAGPSGTNADQFLLAFQLFAFGDVTITCRTNVGSLGSGNFGICLRQAISDQGCAEAVVFLNPFGFGNANESWARRSAQNASFVIDGASNLGGATWLKLSYVSATNTVSMYRSTDGITWGTALESLLIPFSSTQTLVAGLLAWGLPPNSPGVIDNVTVVGNPAANSSTVPGFGTGTFTSNPDTGNSGNPSTSGQVGFLPDILEICQEAAERAGFDFTSGYALRSAKRSLDIMSMEWANEGLNLWTLDFQAQVLTPGTFKYNLPADTMDLIYPSMRTTVGGIQNDISMARFDFASYAAIPNKLFQGKPTQIFVHRIAPIPEFYLWATPDAATTYTVAYWRLRRMQNTQRATYGMDVPFRFIPALIAGLAYKMSQKIKDPSSLGAGYRMPNPRIQQLKADYDELFMKAKYEDRDRSSIYISPASY